MGRHRILLVTLAVLVAAALVLGVAAALRHRSPRRAPAAPRGASAHASGDTRPGARPVPGAVPHHGSVVAEPSGGSGQMPTVGTCTHWTQRFRNDSDARVVRVTFAPAGARYVRGREGSAGYRSWSATKPVAADLNVAIAPRSTQSLEFMLCTSTPPPGGATELVVLPPQRLAWTWADGSSGSGPFA